MLQRKPYLILLALIWLATLTACSSDSGVGAAAASDDQVIIEDLVVGSGATAEAGDTVLVHYIGYLQSTGDQFDSSLDEGTPLWFLVNEDASSFPSPNGTLLLPYQPIEGWRRGIAGMQVGGRRRLTVPPSLGYGSRSQGSIPGNSTLVFIIDLLAVEK